MSSSEVEAFKQGQRAVWAAGDYADIATTIQEVADAVVELAGAGAGVRLLDVATGTGNVAVPAAATGASVTGLDLTPELLDHARARAEQAGVEVTWLQGDAEELPFPDGAFERVTSCFGVIFAPRHARAAAELARVAAPGASIVLTSWTPEGMIGEFFKLASTQLPPPPPGIGVPVQWGEEAHVRDVFAPTGAQLRFERRAVTFRAASPEAWMQRYESSLGPAVMMKAALEPQGLWEPMRAKLVDLFTSRNEAGDGSFQAPGEYLVTIAQIPA